MENKKKINEITYTDRVKLWLEKTNEEKVKERVNYYKGLEKGVKSLDKAVEIVGKEGNVYYKEFIHVLQLALLGEDSEVLKLKDEIAKIKEESESELEELKAIIEELKTAKKEINSSKIKLDVEVRRLKLEVKDKDIIINKLGVKVEDLEGKVNIKSEEIEVLEANILDYKGKLEVSEKEVEDCKSKMGKIGKGKFHVRGTEEFYRDVKIACSYIKPKNGGRVNKKGEPYLDYREAVKHAEGCSTIKNYAMANKVKINRENLINWMKIAEALDRGEGCGVKIGKYKANKGYKG